MKKLLLFILELLLLGIGLFLIWSAYTDFSSPRGINIPTPWYQEPDPYGPIQLLVIGLIYIAYAILLFIKGSTRISKWFILIACIMVFPFILLYVLFIVNVVGFQRYSGF